MNPRAALPLVLVIGTAVGLGGCRDKPEPTVPMGQSTHEITVDGRTREYRIFRPDSLPAKASLVLMFHGGFGTAQQAERDYGWDELAQREHVLIAYPNGINRAWAAGGGCCGIPADTGVDDVAFVTALVADIGNRVPIDPSRVYATGMSNGALMSYRLACDTKLFAAIAPVAGTLLGPCAGPAPISLLHIHGLADRNVPFDGSQGGGVARIDGPPVTETVAQFRALNGCAAATESKVDTVASSIAQCPQGRAVELVTIDGAGHQWPGSARKPVAELIPGIDTPSNALNATEVIWLFFAAHPAQNKP